MADVPTLPGETGRAESVPEAVVVEAARTFWADLQPPFNPDHWVRDEEFGAACQSVWSSALASQADEIAALRAENGQMRGQHGAMYAEWITSTGRIRSRDVEIERLRAELASLRASVQTDSTGEWQTMTGHHHGNGVTIWWDEPCDHGPETHTRQVWYGPVQLISDAAFPQVADSEETP